MTFGVNKYHVAPKQERTIDGICFASKAEASRYVVLKQLLKLGKIKDLQLQPTFVIAQGFDHPIYGNIKAITYRADFSYIETNTNTTVVEDVKGYQTAVYKIKKALFLGRYPDIQFREVK